MRPISSPLLAAGLLSACLAVVGCGLPRDPEDTLTRVRGGTLRVGLAKAPPWTNGAATAAAGIEVDLVRDIARSLDAHIRWVAGSEAELIERLEHFELDLLAAGLEEHTPWSDRVGLTRPHSWTRERGDEVGRVLAVPPGENGWLLYLDRRLGHAPQVPAARSEGRQ